MSESTIWWLLAGLTVGVELMTGTFYLLMLAIGLVAAAFAAHMGLPLTGQLVTAALVGGGAVVFWHLRRSAQPRQAPAQANADVIMDIGEAVLVEAWNPDGTASVRYRGANWTAIHHVGNSADSQQPGVGQYRIKEMQGNRLVLERA